MIFVKAAINIFPSLQIFFPRTELADAGCGDLAPAGLAHVSRLAVGVHVAALPVLLAEHGQAVPGHCNQDT